MKSKMVMSVLALSACVEAKPEQPAMVGMANPASVYCAEKGGRVEIREEAGGQVGYCHLPDGRVIEEWALYRADHPG